MVVGETFSIWFTCKFSPSGREESDGLKDARGTISTTIGRYFSPVLHPVVSCSLVDESMEKWQRDEKNVPVGSRLTEDDGRVHG